MNQNFNDFPCNKCGWCCQRTPCPMGLYLGQKPLSPCTFLKETAENEFECGLILDEIDPIRKEALKELMLAGKGCSHIYGPSPVSLIRELVKRGLTPRSQNWNLAKSNTINEYQSMIAKAEDPKSILKALDEFNSFCQEIEKLA